ncbi:MAG: glutaredoxin family protein [Candidatus Acidiferrales bacterium]
MTAPVITMYTTPLCGDCRRAKLFLQERGVAFREVVIDQSPEAEALVLRVNGGSRKVPTFEVDGRYFSVSPFDPYKLAEELKIPLNA